MKQDADDTYIRLVPATVTSMTNSTLSNCSDRVNWSLYRERYVHYVWATIPRSLARL